MKPLCIYHGNCADGFTAAWAVWKALGDNCEVFSLRSTADGTDVSEIAKQYGGGGHKNASGFRLPHGVSP